MPCAAVANGFICSEQELWLGAKATPGMRLYQEERLMSFLSVGFGPIRVENCIACNLSATIEA